MARVNYTSVIEKDNEMEALTQVEVLNNKLISIDKKIAENNKKIEMAEEHERLAIDLNAEKNLIEEKNNICLLKNIYRIKKR